MFSRLCLERTTRGFLKLGTLVVLKSPTREALCVFSTPREHHVQFQREYKHVIFTGVEF
jgi:hypothetical protein